MSIIRTRRTNHYTTVTNDFARDPRLSLQAKMLLVIMLSYPDDWAFSLQHLSKQSRNGLSATRSAFQELAAAGYVTRVGRARGEQGRMTGWEYEVRDVPTAEAFDAADDDLATDVQFPNVGEPNVAKPNVGEPNATKTVRSTKTEVTNTTTQDQGQKHVSASPTRVPHQAFLDAYNENCGNLPGTRVLNDKRKRGIDTLTREHGDAALSVWVRAVKQAAANDFMVNGGYGMDTLLRPGKALAWSERTPKPGSNGQAKPPDADYYAPVSKEELWAHTDTVRL